MSLSHFEDFPNDLKLKCFEFSLKEHSNLKKGPYDAALPDWDKFTVSYSSEYIPSPEAKQLLAAPPQRQVFVTGKFVWEKTNLDKEKTDLGKVVLILKTIRNNLFHGGKHSQEDWDDPKKNIFFLENGKKVLDSLAKLGSLEADYERYY